MKPFLFRQFAIRQTNAAMKVGTDAMLLGSLCDFPKGAHLLDIGTGTGVLSLMLAQRFEPKSVTAIELDEDACEDARHNFGNAPFDTDFHLHCGAIQTYETEQRFDGIISNPPFFENSYRSGQQSRDTARHTETLAFEDLFIAVQQLLTENGHFWMIFPFEQAERMPVLAAQYSLHLYSHTIIEGKPGKPVRSVMAFSKKAESLSQQTFIVRNADGSYTSEYIELTKDFHGTDLRNPS